jgi:hypothetical protein
LNVMLPSIFAPKIYSQPLITIDRFARSREVQGIWFEVAPDCIKKEVPSMV